MWLESNFNYRVLFKLNPKPWTALKDQGNEGLSQLSLRQGIKMEKGPFLFLTPPQVKLCFAHAWHGPCWTIPWDLQNSLEVDLGQRFCEFGP